MTHSSSLLPCGILAAILFLLFVAIALAIASLVWLDRSDSPRAGRLRRLLGGVEKRRDFGEKKFMWTGEDRVLRQNAAKEFAAKRGLPIEGGDAELAEMLRPFRSALLQSSGKIEDVIRWTDGEERFALFSYTYETIDRFTTSTLLYVDATRLQLPAFLATPETIAHKTIFAGRDIDFDDDPQFSSRYHLEGADDDAVRKLFSRSVRKEFVAAGNCRMECAGSRVVFSRVQQTTLAALENFVDESTRLVNALASGF